MVHQLPHRLQVIDTHTGGEPTRVVIGGGPDLGTGPLLTRVDRFRREHDALRSAIVNEPRGSDVMVGALLCSPTDSTCTTGVIFFNNIGYVGMCGHGTMGVAVALAHLGQLNPGQQVFETPVGKVTVALESSNTVTVQNVVSYRHIRGVPLSLEGDFRPARTRIHGDVAWGGNWFFLVEDHGETVSLANVPRLLALAGTIRQQLDRAGIRGANGAEIDHIELFGPPTLPGAHSKNFVLCPGGAYDRSPCGTGTSAKLACLAAEGKLKEGEIWRQESIVGSVFEGSFRAVPEGIQPTLRGTAYVNAEATLILDPKDPFVMGIR